MSAPQGVVGDEVLFRRLPHPAWLYDVETLRFLEVNEAAMLSFGYSRQEFLAMRISDLSPAAAPADVDMSGPERSFVRSIQRLDGTVVDVEVTARLVDVEGRPAILAVCAEVDSERAHPVLLHDLVTGLPGPVLFLDRLDRAIARLDRAPDPAAIIALGLEPPCADEVLADVGRHLTLGLRTTDTVARAPSGGFLLLCEGVSSEIQAVELVSRLRASLPRPTSSGVVLVDRPGSQAQTVLRQVELARQRSARSDDAPCEVYHPPLRGSTAGRPELERALWKALDDDQFRVVYQPVVSLDTEEVVGAEALVRWQHPELGLVGPAEFVGVAEQSDLIVDLGAWVLSEACRELARWQAVSPALYVSVNVSARQLASPRLSQAVAQAISGAGVDPASVCLEVTESVMMDDADAALEVLTTLKGLGVRLAIDDFGTGYSSLAYIKRFPMDVLKVDRSFVSGIGMSAGDSAIVMAVVDLARTLGLVVVAEGAERLEEVAALRACGCERAQGYYFFRPLVPEGMTSVLPHLAPPSGDDVQSPAMAALRRYARGASSVIHPHDG